MTKKLVGDIAPDTRSIKDRFSSAYLLAMASRTIGELAQLRNAADASGKKLATLSVDTTVCFKNAAEQNKFAEELSAGIASVVRRYQSTKGRSYRVTVGAYPQPVSGDDKEIEDLAQ